MAWQTPKTNWQAGDIPGAGDFNRSEGNTQHLKEQLQYYAKQAELDALKQAKYMHRQTINFTGAGTTTVAHGLGTTNVLVILLRLTEGHWNYAPANTDFRIVDKNHVEVRNVTTEARTIQCVVIRTI